jgi:hypothetical protein
VGAGLLALLQRHAARRAVLFVPHSDPRWDDAHISRQLLVAHEWSHREPAARRRCNQLFPFRHPTSGQRGVGGGRGISVRVASPIVRRKSGVVIRKAAGPRPRSVGPRRPAGET